MEYLKGCPHCGGVAYLRQTYSYKCKCYFTFVKCDICGAQGKVYKAYTEPAAADWNLLECADAAAAWNMRTNEKEQEGKA